MTDPPTTALPIVAARDIAERYCQKQVIVLAWDGQVQHCVTFGVTVQDADQAALGGDRIKRALGWPGSLTGDLPPRVQAIQAALDSANADNEQLRAASDCFSDSLHDASAALTSLQTKYDAMTSAVSAVLSWYETHTTPRSASPAFEALRGLVFPVSVSALQRELRAIREELLTTQQELADSQRDARLYKSALDNAQ